MKTRKEQIITHKIRRYQQDMPDDFEQCGNEEAAPEIPANVTIEAAIRFFEENAKDGYAVLYTRTAAWLKMLFQSDVLKKHVTGGNDAVQAFLKQRADAQFEKEMKKNDGEG